jgi:hypothetical protein
MSTHDHKHTGDQVDYTDKDIKLRPLLLFIAACLLVTAVTIIGINVLMHAFNREVIKDDQFYNEYSLERQLPEGGAVLQGFEAAAKDLARLHAEENALLTKYEWVDQPAGTVRIPIEQAMHKAVAKGYPVRESKTP